MNQLLPGIAVCPVCGYHLDQTEKYTPDFEAFWKLYPYRLKENGNKAKLGKFEAGVAWKKLNANDKLEAMKAVKAMQDDKFLPDACRWLKHKKWTGEIITPIERKQRSYDDARRKEAHLNFDKFQLEELVRMVADKRVHPSMIDMAEFVIKEKTNG